jgi:hypothetical protein
MIIKSHADDTGAVRDLFDGYFFKRRFDDQVFQAVRKRDLYIPFPLQKTTSMPLCPGIQDCIRPGHQQQDPLIGSKVRLG